MSYGLRGLNGTVYGLGACTAADPSGCAGPYSNPIYNYDYQLNQQQSGGANETPAFAPPPPAVYVDPGPENDPAIVEANVQRSIDYQNAVAAAVAANNLQRCLDNNTDPAICASRYPGVAPSGNVYGGVVAQPSAPPPPPPAAKGGSVVFTTSRGGSPVYPGDTWTITINGASPNATVTVQGGKAGTSQNTTPMGSTDANGYFSKSGTFTTADIGTWTESWTVGGAASGTFGFTVAAVPVTPAGVPVVQPGATPPGAVTGAPSGSSSGFSISDVPWWGWALAAGAGLMAFGGKR